ncbi:DgyrCDS14129 [Dimorphilus gyrociliatus]|uniref:DgyrCDS14129 n=1 Tax=Dimorphilus gyrociliatus TaxID=2664684 RepID=A0A7I8WCV1_9ANNE|nr:DgyrCDS14129 [Dimorphilus gyrociliatus]
MKFLIASIALLSAIAIPYTLAVKCYSCTSVTDSKCGDKFSGESTSNTCTALSTGGCSKTKVGSVVTRSCSITLPNEKCSEVTVAGVTTATCYCKGEKCNSSSTIKPLLEVFGLIFSVLFFLY